MLCISDVVVERFCVVVCLGEYTNDKCKKGINKMYEIFCSSFDKAELTNPADGCQNYQMHVLSPPKAGETAKGDTEERVFLRQVCTFSCAGPRPETNKRGAGSFPLCLCVARVF